MSEPMSACPVVSIDKIKEDHKEGVFVVVTQDGCGNCEMAKQILKEEHGSKSVVEVPTAHCVPIVEELQVKQTPVVMFYKDGQQQRFEADGTITWGEFREKVRALGTA